MALSSYLNRRYLLVLVVSAVLCFALYAVTVHQDSYEGARDAAYRVWKEPFWSGGSSLRDTKALSYVGRHPDSLEGWEDGSLKRWADSPDIDPEYYTTEHSPRPTSGPYTGGVVWLTRRQHIRETLASLETLARYMPMEQAYSFILLHSGDLAGPDVQRETLSAWAERAEELTELGQGELAGKMKVMGQGIEFVQIDLAAPVEWQREGIRHRDDVVFDGVWPGYHSMCRFFAAEIFWHPRIRQLDYYMRMDHDSYILTPMHMDPFKRMHTTGKSYIFRQPSGDGEWVLKGLPDYIEAWVDAHEHDAGAEGIRHRVDDSRLIAAPRNERNGGMESYYNNWEMAHVPSFRRKGVRDWLVGLLEHNDGFYKSRWGDAPLRFATVKMFFEEHEYEQWCDFTYYHQQMMPEGERLTDDASLDPFLLPESRLLN